MPSERVCRAEVGLNRERSSRTVRALEARLNVTTVCCHLGTDSRVGVRAIGDGDRCRTTSRDPHDCPLTAGIGARGRNRRTAGTRPSGHYGVGSAKAMSVHREVGASGVAGIGGIPSGRGVCGAHREHSLAVLNGLGILRCTA